MNGPCIFTLRSVETKVKEAADLKETITYRPIGHVESVFAGLAAPEELASVESQIVLDPGLVEGLRGLEPGQCVTVVFHFHRSQGYDLTQHPRSDRSRPELGVFALRSPRRPNPIGITIVELLAIEDNVLRVRGLDAIDGTPVLDLKPASCDEQDKGTTCREQAKGPGDG